MRLLALGLLSLGLSSCAGLEGLSATFNVPLPDQFGGGSIPITIEK
jgi:hypothetical protein